MFAGKQQRCRTFLWTGRTSQITATLRFDFTKIQIGGKDKWLITKQKKNIDGTSGKQRKRRSFVSRVWMNRRSRSSGSMTGTILTQSGDSGNIRPHFWTVWNCFWKKKNQESLSQRVWKPCSIPWRMRNCSRSCYRLTRKLFRWLF